MRKKLNLIGQKFGKLTVVEKMEERQYQYYVWRCQCDCGKEIMVNTNKLMRGLVTNCGCDPQTSKREKDGSNNAKEKKRRHTGIADITGKRFGRLLAIYSTDKRDKKGSVYWHCQCDCGKEVDVTEDALMYGNYKSCGCLKKEIQQDINHKLHHVDGTCVEWLEKRKKRCDNTSGFRGVYQRKNGKYKVTIGFKKQKYYIGTYNTFDEAVAARLEMEEMIHGGFIKAYYIWNETNDPSKTETPDPFIFQVEKKGGKLSVTTNIKTISE